MSQLNTDHHCQVTEGAICSGSVCNVPPMFQPGHTHGGFLTKSPCGTLCGVSVHLRIAAQNTLTYFQNKKFHQPIYSLLFFSSTVDNIPANLKNFLIRQQFWIFTQFNIFHFQFSHISPFVFFASNFNLLCEQLVIFIWNLSFSANFLSSSCLLSCQHHCLSPLIESWNYLSRCSCFLVLIWCLLLPHCLRVCFTLSKTASLGGLLFFPSYLLPFSLLEIPGFSVSSLYMDLNILYQRFSLCHVCLSCSTFLLLRHWPLQYTADYCPEGHFYFLILTWGSFLAV